MHTDEFEISLSRELKVCENTIRRIRKTLAMMEQKHHKPTEAFIEEYKSGRMPVDPDCRDDFTAWESSYEALTKWQDLERQYQEQYGIMKISKGKSQPQR